MEVSEVQYPCKDPCPSAFGCLPPAMGARWVAAHLLQGQHHRGADHQRLTCHKPLSSLLPAHRHLVGKPVLQNVMFLVITSYGHKILFVPCPTTHH